MTAVTPHGTFRKLSPRKLAAVAVWKHELGDIAQSWHTAHPAPKRGNGWELLGVYPVGTVEQVPWRHYVPQSRSDFAADLEGVL